MLKYIAAGLSVLCLILIWMLSRETKHVEVTSSTVMDKVEKVLKLVTAEGYFTEIYSHKDFTHYDFAPFRKQAMLKVKAKVLAGYDLTKATFEYDDKDSTIWISNLPEPQIIAIDHEVSYYDITEGYLNSFSEAELTKLQAEAKKMIETEALKSPLMTQAKAQGDAMLELIRLLVQSDGWKVVVGKNDAVPKEN